MSAVSDTETEARVVALLAELREGLEAMRSDLARLGGELTAIRQEAERHDAATRRQLGQVASWADRKGQG